MTVWMIWLDGWMDEMEAGRVALMELESNQFVYPYKQTNKHPTQKIERRLKGVYELIRKSDRV